MPPPARHRRATEHVEGRLLGQLPDRNLSEFRGDLGDPGLYLRAHLGEVLAQGLGKHLRTEEKRGENKCGEDHPCGGFF